MSLPSFRERLQPCRRVEPPSAVFMAEAKRRRPFLPSLALLVAATLPLSAHSQQPGTLPSVRLEPHDGKTTFYLGEPIRLDLVFENRTGAPFMLNTTGYGDLSEKVEITPAEGWFQWQTQSSHTMPQSPNSQTSPSASRSNSTKASSFVSRASIAFA